MDQQDLADRLVKAGFNVFEGAAILVALDIAKRHESEIKSRIGEHGWKELLKLWESGQDFV